MILRAKKGCLLMFKISEASLSTKKSNSNIIGLSIYKLKTISVSMLKPKTIGPSILKS